MTVSELIKELKELPQNLPIVTDYKEITDVDLIESFYFLNNQTKTGYDIGPAVILE